MKINLCFLDDIREGEYINVGTKERTKLASNVYRQGAITNLDWLCEDNSVDEILALNILNYIPFEKFIQTFKNWFNKLQSKGVLKISIIDLYIISKYFTNSQINIEQFLEHIWGNKNNRKCSSIDSFSLCNLLTTTNFKIIGKRYDGISFYAEAIKE